MADDVYDLIFGIEEYDPCAALLALRPAYMRAVAGGGEQKIEFRDRAVWYQPTQLTSFGALIRQLESECAAKKGVTIVRRRAITAGAPPGGNRIR